MDPLTPGKYARVECERRFLLAAPPERLPDLARRITDRYLTGTRMRLRRIELSATELPPGIELPGAAPESKLTQKIPAPARDGGSGAVQGLITTTYLSPAEYEVFAVLPARVLRKTRFSLPPLGVDVFEPPLHGLVLAEAEFDSAEAAGEFAVPDPAVAEVTRDPRFTGGRLAVTDRPELLEWLAEFGVRPE